LLGGEMRELMHKQTLCTHKKIEYDSEEEMQKHREELYSKGWFVTKTKSIEHGKFIVGYTNYDESALFGVRL